MLTHEQFIVFNRFGYGLSVREQDLAREDPDRWLDEQLERKAAEPIRGVESSSLKLLRAFREVQSTGSREKRQAFREQGQERLKQTIVKRVELALTTKAPFIERLAAFWSNHFTVSAKAKARIAGMIASYENEAIRPHVLGKFEDMLIAVVQHPAMLIYLDNVQSFGPNSRVGQNNNRGLNENLAREILELHTLGVDGGYDQDDVLGLAKIITGWTLSNGSGDRAFTFNPYIHEPGNKYLLGEDYNGGYDPGEQALRDLARHPSTAKFLATKLARHFISDNPDERDIDRLADTYLKTGGNLKEVYERLIKTDAVWDNATPKFKAPQDYILSTLRTLGLKDQKTIKKTLPSFSLMNQNFYTAPSPAGWGDRERDWLSPDSMINRLEWANAVCQRIPDSEFLFRHMRAVIAPASTANTLFWIDRAPSLKEGLALALASPAHQRR